MLSQNYVPEFTSASGISENKSSSSVLNEIQTETHINIYKYNKRYFYPYYMIILTGCADESHLCFITASTFLKVDINIFMGMLRRCKSAVLFCVLYIPCCLTSFAQSPESKTSARTKVAITGNFIIATDFESVYTNFGGPALKFSFSKNLHGCISMYPSIRWKKDSSKPTALPMLGTGVHIGYKHMILDFLFYYISSNNRFGLEE